MFAFVVVVVGCFFFFGLLVPFITAVFRNGQIRKAFGKYPDDWVMLK